MPALMEYNPFGVVLVIFPAATLVLSFILQLFIRKKAVIIAVTFAGYLIATYTVFNSSFLIWCFVYTVIAGVGTILADACRRVAGSRSRRAAPVQPGKEKEQAKKE